MIIFKSSFLAADRSAFDYFCSATGLCYWIGAFVNSVFFAYESKFMAVLGDLALVPTSNVLPFFITLFSLFFSSFGELFFWSSLTPVEVVR